MKEGLKVDWDRHWSVVLKHLKALVDRYNCLAEPQAPFDGVGLNHMNGIAMRLASRHVPNEIRERLRWRTLTSFVRTFYDLRRPFKYDDPWDYQDLENQAEPLVRDFACHQAPALITAVQKIREEFMGSEIDANKKNGVLNVAPHGPVSDVTVRIPTNRLDELTTFVAALNADRKPMTIDLLRARLQEFTPKFQELGVTEIWVFGSVARGDCTAMSDIDLLSVDDGSISANSFFFSFWDDLQRFLEDQLGYVVDLHRYVADHVVARSAVLVWRRQGEEGPNGNNRSIEAEERR